MRRDIVRERGVVLLLALACLAAIAGMLLLAARRATANRRELRRAERLQQVDWLLASALNRARAALARNASYNGEVWSIPAEELDGHDAAFAAIRVDAVAADSRPRIIEVELVLGPNSATPIRRFRRAGFSLEEAHK